MKRVDPKERALLEVRRRKSELDQIENFLGGCSESGLEFLRGLLVRKATPPSPLIVARPQTDIGTTAKEKTAAIEPGVRIGRLRTSKGSLKRAILDEIQSLDAITSVTIHERLVQKGFKFSTERSVASIFAWLRKLTREGVLIQVNFGKGVHPVEFRKFR